MQKRLSMFIGALALGGATAAMAQSFPLWEQALHDYSSKTDQTPVPSMKMGKHMQMSLKAPAQPGDEQRATAIAAAAKRVLAHYADVNTALADGYKPFFPSGKMGEEVHYTSYRYTRLGRQHIDYDHPGSILYRRTPQGMQAVGVMYSAAQNATAEQLNAIVPLSIATWHRHVDFCGAPKNLPLGQQYGPHAAFGPQGSIHTEQACEDAHGLWLPVVFGWMTHVYPNAKNPADVWAGMTMHMDMSDDDKAPGT
ncbi:MAG TPA: hypothetical protein VME63_12095 [Dyella sp.]|uniref:hypothetical protein n=1 Tax=Dyella sp. TaxID=1869338 RepID=UPI002CA1F1FB|nr:hypothetical protein [Dyella sp.]HTV86145.1 hypothetical protein [Dyella sp.]